MTFRDFLHHIVGPDVIAELLSTYPGYDEDVNPGIANVFGVAAFRFAHLMIQPIISRLDEQYEEHPEYPSDLLHRNFFTPWRMIFEGRDEIFNFLVLSSRIFKTEMILCVSQVVWTLSWEG